VSNSETGKERAWPRAHGEPLSDINVDERGAEELANSETGKGEEAAQGLGRHRSDINLRLKTKTELSASSETGRKAGFGAGLGTEDSREPPFNSAERPGRLPRVSLTVLRGQGGSREPPYQS